VSTAGQGGEGPRYDPYGQRGSQQGGQGEPGSYGSPPPYGQPGQYAYNPYAPAPYPAASGTGPVKRPGIMVLSLVLLVLSTLPFLFFGVVLLAVPADSGALKTLLDGIGQPAGATADQLVTIIRIVGGVFTGVAVIYILFAALAFAGRGWARIVTTVLTALFVVLLILGVVRGGGGDVTSLGLVLVIGALAVVGTLLLYQPKARDYYAARRAR
jgi:hypothetical protein